MARRFLMGNEAIALGALHAGISLAAGYPGTPSTEILEAAARGDIHAQWSVNEKAALEVAAGASYAGARTLVTMKQVGLNVASDPLMSLAYVGVKGGMVIVAADDPGPISSQTEQDTRLFASFAKVPVFDPSSTQEAYEMIQEAFEYSEKYQTPVLFRPTTRVCHGCASVTVKDSFEARKPEGFVKETARWVIFPRTSYLNHIKLEERYAVLSDDFSGYLRNFTDAGRGKKGIITGGISYMYVKEALREIGAEVPVLKISTPYPFPQKLALSFLTGLDEVLAVEELEPVLEKEMLLLAGKKHLAVDVKGKLTGNVQPAGENSAESVKRALIRFLGLEEQPEEDKAAPPELPVRPPVLCAGCPHRASFYAVKKAMQGKKAVFAGDIGCYTLGNAMPLDMVDTCLCMGADITIAQGLHIIEPDGVHFSFIGDSTFFASGITGIINAVYNQTDIIVIVLDNSTTAMTGHQPHPGTGYTVQGKKTTAVSIPAVLRAVGVEFVETVDPFDQEKAVRTVRRAAEEKGVKAIIFKAPCIAVEKRRRLFEIDRNKCINCRKCVRELGCPAIEADKNGVKIEADLCFGCSLCAQVCPVSAIREGGEKNV